MADGDEPRMISVAGLIGSGIHQFSAEALDEMDVPRVVDLRPGTLNEENVAHGLSRRLDDVQVSLRRE